MQINKILPLRISFSAKPEQIQSKTFERKFFTQNQTELPSYTQVTPNILQIINHKNNAQEFSTKEILESFKEFKPGIIPDRYQIDAAKSIAKGNSTIVTAPTGTGKTLIAEFAIHNNLKNGNRTFYTTPLKALSNQKYEDFKKEFGAENVGIMTGDTKKNVDAPIIVMTTEVYRNMLNSVFDNEQKDSLENLKTVILDEFHYMDDSDRGMVWEESIMKSPKNVQILSLSATVQNPDLIAWWMNFLNPTKTADLINVSSSERHVPLRFYQFQTKDKDHLLEYCKTPIDISKINLNRLSDRTKQALEEIGEGIGENDAEQGYEMLKYLFENDKYLSVDELSSRLVDTKQFSEEDAIKISLVLSQAMPSSTMEEPVKKNTHNEKFVSLKNKQRELMPKVNTILDSINPESSQCQFNGFPAIAFVFSRKGCEEFANSYFMHRKYDKRSSGNSFARKQKMQKIAEIIDKAEKSGKVLGSSFDAKAYARLMAGIAVHHAGMLPAHKELVEELFRENLLDVVFATETLAAGINMPAKTTIISSFTKPTDNGKVRELSVNEFQQMAGRAGRRGIDKIGNVITIPANNYEIQKGKFYATTTPNPIRSKFDINYNDVINLLYQNNGVIDFEELHEFIGDSFAVFNSENPQKTKQTLVYHFNTLLGMLKTKQYIEKTGDNKYIIAPKARILTEIKGTNELFLSELIHKGILSDLDPYTLAAIICSITEDDFFNEPVELSLLPSGIKKALINILPIMDDINFLMSKNQTDIHSSVDIDATQAKYIKEFLFSTEPDYEIKWNNIIEKMKKNGNLYFEGNFFRSLNSGLDLLKQIRKICQKGEQIAQTPKELKNFDKLLKNTEKAIELLQIPPIYQE